MTKKVLVTIATITTLLSSAALAQSFDPSAGSGNLVGPYNSAYSGPNIPRYASMGKLVSGSRLGSASSAFAAANDAYAYAPVRHRHHRHE